MIECSVERNELIGQVMCAFWMLTLARFRLNWVRLLGVELGLCID